LVLPENCTMNRKENHPWLEMLVDYVWLCIDWQVVSINKGGGGLFGNGGIRPLGFGHHVNGGSNPPRGGDSGLLGGGNSEPPKKTKI
jgi:hypothetical protein